MMDIRIGRKLYQSRESLNVWSLGQRRVSPLDATFTHLKEATTRECQNCPVRENGNWKILGVEREFVPIEGREDTAESIWSSQFNTFFAFSGYNHQDSLTGSGSTLANSVQPL
jgi:hypothetical protein